MIPDRTDPAAVDHEVVIVGAGFGGMGAAIQLRRQGIDDLLVLDREAAVGGTWHINTYPGIAVDIASVTYSYSFEPNPSWSRVYAPGEELAAYAEHVADTYDLRRHMRLSTTVRGAGWQADLQRWEVTLDTGEVLTCRILVVATGFLSHPKVPDIPGLDDFAGDVVHTARWDDDVVLAGRRVAVIGTGATSVQLLPEIAPIVGHLDVYQRTPIWVVPKVDGPIPGLARGLFRHLPLSQAVLRHANSTVLELLGAGVLYHRQFPALIPLAQGLARAHLFRQVRSAELRRKLTPDYDLFCKRPTFSNSYFPTFTRDDVDLVTDPIQRISADGITTVEGVHRPADVLVLATGFALMEEGNYPPFPIVGRDGVELGERWRTGRFTSYEGLTVPGYPNLLYLPSPYAFTGLSYFFTIETQMAQIQRLVAHLHDTGAATFEPTREAEARFMARMDAAAPSTVWHTGDCATSNSYYFNEHGDTSLARLSPTVQARRRARRFRPADFTFENPRVPDVVRSA